MGLLCPICRNSMKKISDRVVGSTKYAVYQCVKCGHQIVQIE